MEKPKGRYKKDLCNNQESYQRTKQTCLNIKSRDNITIRRIVSK
jgi:hypothetical protein